MNNMKISTALSVLVLSALVSLGGVVQADTKDAEATRIANEADAGIKEVKQATEEAVEEVEQAADEAVEEVEQVVEAVENTDDRKDAEENRTVSDTSLAITSQNEYIRKIMENTTHIKAERLMEILAEGEADDIIFLDIRPRSEFAEIKGVPGVELNIPRNFLEVEAYEKLPELDAAIIIISSKGIRGGLAAHTLQDMGYTNVRNLLGGLEAWESAQTE